jgi:hypothetical protein
MHPIEMSRKAFVKEHKKLIKLLSAAGREGKRQAAELKRRG